MHPVINHQPIASTLRTDKLKISDFRNMIIHAFEERLRFAVETREPGHVPLQDRIPLGDDVLDAIRKGAEFTPGPYFYKMQMAAMSMNASQLVEMANAVPEALGRNRMVTNIELHHLKPPAYQWMVHMTTGFKAPAPTSPASSVSSAAAGASLQPSLHHQVAATEAGRMHAA